MASIGSTLREERIRLGLGIDQIEADTKIRAKYLMALEDERFEALPGTAYARAFLRDYAEQLGLDPQELVDRLNTVVGLEDDVVLAPRRPVATGPILGRWQWIALGGVLAVVVALLAFAVYSVVGGGSGGTASGAALGATAGGRLANDQAASTGPKPPHGSEGEGHVPCRPGKHLARGAAGLGEGQGPLRARARRRQPHPPRRPQDCGSTSAPPGTSRSRSTAPPRAVPSKVTGHLLVTRSGVRTVA